MLINNLTVWSRVREPGVMLVTCLGTATWHHVAGNPFRDRVAPWSGVALPPFGPRLLFDASHSKHRPRSLLPSELRPANALSRLGPDAGGRASAVLGPPIRGEGETIFRLASSEVQPAAAP
jgi:hypothetical protein